MRRFTVATAVLAVALLPAALAAQSAPAAPSAADMEVTSASSIQWTDAEVPGFDPGMQIAPISGDPAADGQPYTLRLRFPDGYQFPMHWHPNAENLTVLSGTFHLAMAGEKSDELVTYQAGDYLHIPGRMAHRGGATGETVIQLHGVGPFTIELGEPK